MRSFSHSLIHKAVHQYLGACKNSHLFQPGANGFYPIADFFTSLPEYIISADRITFSTCLARILHEGGRLKKRSFAMNHPVIV